MTHSVWDDHHPRELRGDGHPPVQSSVETRHPLFQWKTGAREPVLSQKPEAESQFSGEKPEAGSQRTRAPRDGGPPAALSSFGLGGDGNLPPDLLTQTPPRSGVSVVG